MLRYPLVTHLACLLALGFSEMALAEDGTSFQALGSFSLLETARTRNLRRYAVNKENQTLQIPERLLEASVRPNMKLSLSPFTFIFRPRLTLLSEQVRLGEEWQSPDTSLSPYTNEGFLQWQFAEDMSFTYGRQSFQWGAAEAASPSNRIFIDPVQARDFSSEVQGKSIARLNLSWSQRFSLVSLVEFEDSRTQEQKEEDPEAVFASAGLIKPELNWNNGADYVGLVFGAREFRKPWIGAYLNLGMPFVEGLSFYLDVAQEKGTQAFYPGLVAVSSQVRDGNSWDNNGNNNGGWNNGDNNNNGNTNNNNGNANNSNEPPPPVNAGNETSPAGPGLNQNEGTSTDSPIIAFNARDPEQEKSYRFEVYGLKYDFTDGSIFRLEYLHADAAYEKNERLLLKKAFLSADPRQLALTEANLKAYLKKAPEMPGQGLVYASLYWPDLLDLKDAAFQGRVLHSLLDKSYGAYTQLSYKFGDHGTFYVSAQWADGTPYSEMAGFIRSTYSIALRQDW